jgi:hypothetical protein
VPEQEFPPLRPPAGSYRRDRDDQDPPPWADLPPVRPVQPRRRPDRGDPAGHGRPASGGRPPGPLGSSAPGGSAGPPRPVDPGPSFGAPHPASLLDPLDPADPHRDDQVPPWAGPDVDDDEDAPLAQPREPGARAVRAAARRRRRWFVLAGALVVVAGAVLAVVLLTGGGPGPAAVTPGALITTFQPGELQQVPSACTLVPAATVQHYLPGKTKVASPLPVDGAAESACNWTIDQAPVYRLMELNLLAYAPNGLASGDGSATYAAIDGYDSTLQNLQAPPKGSPSPRATVTMLPGLGNQAFSASQVFRAGGAVTDVATVVVRYHNVVVTATLNGLEHANRGTYGPVSPSALSAAALAFAQAAEASLH